MKERTPEKKHNNYYDNQYATENIKPRKHYK
jgi:hypothetical protein